MWCIGFHPVLFQELSSVRVTLLQLFSFFAHKYRSSNRRTMVFADLWKTKFRLIADISIDTDKFARLATFTEITWKNTWALMPVPTRCLCCGRENQQPRLRPRNTRRQVPCLKCVLRSQPRHSNGRVTSKTSSINIRPQNEYNCQTENHEKPIRITKLVTPQNPVNLRTSQ